MKRYSITHLFKATVMSVSAIVAAHIAIAAPVQAIPSDSEWDELPSPEIVSIDVNPQDPFELLVHYRGEVGPGAASEAVAVAVVDPETIVEGGAGAATSAYSLTSSEGVISVAPKASGTIEVQVLLKRDNQNVGKYSDKEYVDFVRPLHEPQGVRVTAERTRGELVDIDLQWNAVPTAVSYTMEYRIAGSEFRTQPMGMAPRSVSQRGDASGNQSPPTWGTITGIPAGSKLEIRVSAHRPDRSATSGNTEYTAGLIHTDPGPTTPAPTTPAPTEPGATNPGPTNPAPATPSPTASAPTNPGQTSPVPTAPEPVERVPSTSPPSVPGGSFPGQPDPNQGELPGRPSRAPQLPISRNDADLNSELGAHNSHSGNGNPAHERGGTESATGAASTPDPDDGFTIVPGATAEQRGTDEPNAPQDDPSEGSKSAFPGASGADGGAVAVAEGAASINTDVTTSAGIPDPATESGSRLWVLLGMLVVVAVAISSTGALVRRLRGTPEA